MYLLDSNTIAALIRKDVLVAKRLKEAFRNDHKVTISAYNHFEIIRGLYLPEHQRRYDTYKELLLSWEILAFDLQTFEIAARIYQILKPMGLLVDDPDLLIAANAIQHNATLVTDNTKHFERIEGLKLENWIERT
jgi:tRNA(fMet)-specific endonuclease VapC